MFIYIFGLVFQFSSTAYFQVFLDGRASLKHARLTRNNSDEFLLDSLMPVQIFFLRKCVGCLYGPEQSRRQLADSVSETVNQSNRSSLQTVTNSRHRERKWRRTAFCDVSWLETINRIA